jgi:crossover junction endodeoxyribonuclease RuvC
LRVLGVDPGSQATGYGVIDRVGSELHWVAHGVLRPRARARSRCGSPRSCSELAPVIAQYAPDVASVEDVFVAASPRSALVLGQARGAVLAALGAAAVPLVQYAPARIKQAWRARPRAEGPDAADREADARARERCPPPTPPTRSPRRSATRARDRSSACAARGRVRACGCATSIRSSCGGRDDRRLEGVLLERAPTRCSST